MTPFHDRFDAGARLGERLRAYAGRPGVLVLAMPRGGVPVAYEVARRLGAPMDVFLVRKLGVPGFEELAMGAIASGGAVVINRDVVEAWGISREVIDTVTALERQELERRELEYRQGRSGPEIGGKVIILVDDGLATGATMRAVVRALREKKPAYVIVAVPTAAAETCAELREEVDEVICTLTPDPFYGVGLSYEDFRQTTDDEVRDLLNRSLH